VIVICYLTTPPSKKLDVFERFGKVAVGSSVEAIDALWPCQKLRINCVLADASILDGTGKKM